MHTIQPFYNTYTLLAAGFCERWPKACAWVCAGSVRQLLIMAKNLPLTFSGLGEEADLKAHTFSLAQMPIESTNVQISTKPAFLPSVC
jgi:hypothetical protein